jgi:RNA polymerase sigma-70 factor, ECF subfamily
MPQSDDTQTTLVQRLFVQHIVPLRGFLLGLTADPHRVDDLVQETFLTAVEKAGDFRVGTKFRAWIFTIARFKLLAMFRDASRAPVSPLEPEIIEALCELAPDFSENDARLQHLPGCLEKLAPQARRTMDLCYEQARRPAEIAADMGWTPGAVKVTLSRARALVRQCIEQQLAGDAR